MVAARLTGKPPFVVCWADVPRDATHPSLRPGNRALISVPFRIPSVIAREGIAPKIFASSKNPDPRPPSSRSARKGPASARAQGD